MSDKKDKKRIKSIVLLLFALIVVVFGTILFVGAVSGWFSDTRVELSAEYVCDGECESKDLMELDAATYEDLIRGEKSFVVLIDQAGCKTAEHLKGFLRDYMYDKGFKAYRMMFSDMKETSLHEYVKYYPSVVVVSKGKVVGYLRADEEADAEMYNNQQAFDEWINRWL